MRLITIISIAVVISGCMQAGPSAELTAQVKEKQDACRSDFSFKEHAIQRAKCINDAIEPLVKFNPAPDLLRLVMATRVEIAEKLQKGEITQAEAELAFAKATADAESEWQRRRNGATIAAAQESAALAATMPHTCYTLGNVTNCY